MLEQEHEHSSPWALIPLVVFISIFLDAVSSRKTLLLCR